MLVCAIIYDNIYLNYEFIEIYWRSRGSLWNHNQDKNPIKIKFMSG